MTATPERAQRARPSHGRRGFAAPAPTADRGEPVRGAKPPSRSERSERTRGEPARGAKPLSRSERSERPHRLLLSSQAFVKRFAGSARRSTARMSTSVEFAFSTSSKKRISSGYQTSVFLDSL